MYHLNNNTELDWTIKRKRSVEPEWNKDRNVPKQFYSRREQTYIIRAKKKYRHSVSQMDTLKLLLVYRVGRVRYTYLYIYKYIFYRTFKIQTKPD